jgi:hypothetical protein
MKMGGEMARLVNMRREGRKVVKHHPKERWDPCRCQLWDRVLRINGMGRWGGGGVGLGGSDVRAPSTLEIFDTHNEERGTKNGGEGKIKGY